MKKYHDVSDIKFEKGCLSLKVDGQENKFKLKEISSILEKASEKERNTYEISSSGYGINWPLIDEDISIDGLLGIAHSPELKKKTA